MKARTIEDVNKIMSDEIYKSFRSFQNQINKKQLLHVVEQRSSLGRSLVLDEINSIQVKMEKPNNTTKSVPYITVEQYNDVYATKDGSSDLLKLILL